MKIMDQIQSKKILKIYSIAGPFFISNKMMYNRINSMKQILLRNVKAKFIACKIICIFVYITPTFAQQNPLGAIIGGILNSAIIKNTKEQWDKVPSNKKQCMNSILNKKNISITALIQNGIGPNDARLTDVVAMCKKQKEDKIDLSEIEDITPIIINSAKIISVPTDANYSAQDWSAVKKFLPDLNFQDRSKDQTKKVTLIKLKNQKEFHLDLSGARSMIFESYLSSLIPNADGSEFLYSKIMQLEPSILRCSTEGNYLGDELYFQLSLEGFKDVIGKYEYSSGSGGKWESLTFNNQIKIPELGSKTTYGAGVWTDNCIKYVSPSKDNKYIKLLDQINQFVEKNKPSTNAVSFAIAVDTLRKALRNSDANSTEVAYQNLLKIINEDSNYIKFKNDLDKDFEEKNKEDIKLTRLEASSIKAYIENYFYKNPTTENAISLGNIISLIDDNLKQQNIELIKKSISQAITQLKSYNLYNDYLKFKSNTQ